MSGPHLLTRGVGAWPRLVPRGLGGQARVGAVLALVAPLGTAPVALVAAGRRSVGLVAPLGRTLALVARLRLEAIPEP